MIDALLALGPMSSVEIAAHLGWPRNRVEATVSMARTNHPGKFFRIVRYELQSGRQGREVSIYAAGPGPDAPRPDFGKAHKRAINRRYHQKHRAIRAAQRRARSSGALQATPWDGLLLGKRQ